MYTKSELTKIRKAIKKAERNYRLAVGEIQGLAIYIQPFLRKKYQ